MKRSLSRRFRFYRNYYRYLCVRTRSTEELFSKYLTYNRNFRQKLKFYTKIEILDKKDILNKIQIQFPTHDYYGIDTFDLVLRKSHFSKYVVYVGTSGLVTRQCWSKFFYDVQSRKKQSQKLY